MTVEDAEIKTFGNSIPPQMQLASVESCSAECCPSDRPQRAGLGGLSGGSACDRRRYRLPCCSTLLRALSGHCLDDVQRQLAGQPPRCIPPAVPAVGDFAEIGLPRMCQRQGLISGKSGGRPKCRLIFAHECPAAGGVPHPCKCQQDIPCVVLQSIQQGWKQIMHSAPDVCGRPLGCKRNLGSVWACDQVRSCVRPRRCGLSCAAGLYGDMQVGTSSLTRAQRRSVRNAGLPDPVS